MKQRQITESLLVDTGDEKDSVVSVTVNSKDDLILLRKGLEHGNTYGIDGDGNTYKRIIGG